MKRSHLVFALLLFAGTVFAQPKHDWGTYPYHGNEKQLLQVPEPGVAAMLTVTAGTIVGALGLRRYFNRATS
ncbi:MAG TPA: hypothetical protein VEI01_16660 [Terriglobales bacterium]|nr:hypothetical protein [Terriglobales bacterium]